MATYDKLKRLLAQARHLENQTVRSSLEIAQWHREVDKVLAGWSLDDPNERYDSPERAEHREFVRRVSRF